MTGYGALSLLELVVSDGDAFGTAPGADHRAVEVEGDALALQRRHALEHQLGA